MTKNEIRTRWRRLKIQMKNTLKNKNVIEENLQNIQIQSDFHNRDILDQSIY